MRTETGYTADPPQSRADMLQAQRVSGSPGHLLRQAQLVQLGGAGAIRSAPHVDRPLACRARCVTPVTGASLALRRSAGSPVPDTARHADGGEGLGRRAVTAATPRFAIRCGRGHARAPARARSMPRRSSSPTSSAAASCSRRRRSRPRSRALAGSCSTWVAGGALAFAGAMAYAELAALRPRAGGEYVYLRVGVRAARRIPDRLDLVRRRLLRRDRRQRGGPGRLRRPIHPRRQRRHGALRGPACRSCR